MKRQSGAVAVIVLLLVGIVLAAGCGGGDGGESPPEESTSEPTAIEGVSTIAPFPVTVVRSDGKSLTIGAPPARIVSLSPSATEILFAIGAEGSLVAVDASADFPAAAASFATRLDAAQPDVEAIAALNPDLVIVASNGTNIVEALDARNIPTFYQDEALIVTVSDVFTHIALFGRITGTQSETETLLSSLDARVGAVTDSVQGLSQAAGPKVYHEVNPQFLTASEVSLEGDLYELLRARNIAGAGGGNAYPQLSPETIIAANPDVIIVAETAGSASVEAVAGRNGWGAIAAVQNDKIRHD